MRTRLGWLQRAAIIIFCMAISTDVALADGIRVELSNAKDVIRILIVNSSNRVINVNTRLANGLDIGWWEVYFEVYDVKGHEMDFTAKAIIGPPEKSDWRDLRPGEIIGREIPLDRLEFSYDLKAGSYDVRAVYMIKNEAGEILQSYRSNFIKIAIRPQK